MVNLRTGNANPNGAFFQIQLKQYSIGDTKGRSPLAWQSSRARGVAATPREGTGQSRRREGRGGRSQWRSALPQAGLNGAWREYPDAPARSAQSRYLGPRSFPPAADSFYAIGAARCRGRLSNGVFYP